MEDNQKRFIAIHVTNNQSSGLKATQKEAEDWAAAQLAKNINIAAMLIFKSVAVVERADVPVTIRQIDDWRADKAPEMVQHPASPPEAMSHEQRVRKSANESLNDDQRIHLGWGSNRYPPNDTI